MANLRLEVKYNRLPEMYDKFPRETDQIVRQQLFVTEDDVKTNIVKYDAIDTSNMINTVASKPDSSGGGEVVSPAEYSAYVNYGYVRGGRSFLFGAVRMGGSHVPARPFFSDAVEKARREFPERFRELERRLR